MAQNNSQVPPQGGGAVAGGLATEHPARKTVKVTLYDGAKVVVTFYIPTENGIVEKRVVTEPWPKEPDWLSKIVGYMYRYGTRREVRTYNPVVRREYIWWFYETEVPVEELLHMIKSTNWQRSKHAREIVELLEQINDSATITTLRL